MGVNSFKVCFECMERILKSIPNIFRFCFKLLPRIFSRGLDRLQFFLAFLTLGAQRYELLLIFHLGLLLSLMRFRLQDIHFSAPLIKAQLHFFYILVFS